MVVRCLLLVSRGLAHFMLSGFPSLISLDILGVSLYGVDGSHKLGSHRVCPPDSLVGFDHRLAGAVEAGVLQLGARVGSAAIEWRVEKAA